MKRILLLITVLCFAVTSMMAQRTVSGKVTDESGGPLPGVNVLIKGTTTGAQTDLDGNFTLSVPDGATLVFSYVGFETQEVVVGSRTTIDLSMGGATELQEVVVTALGQERDKKALGYAVQQVDGDNIAQTRETHLVNALQGQIAGVQIQGSQSTLGGSSRITIRGANSFTGDNQPLFVVDGVPIGNSDFSSGSQQRGFGGGSTPYDYGNAISDINPADIESMSVLKGAAATAIYGVRGANGVIVITTKKGRKRQGIGVSVNSAVTFDKVQNLIPHQQHYGGGATQSTTSGFVEFTENGTAYLAPVYAKDGSWGPKYDAGTQVRHWDSWDPDAANYGETRPWVAPENGYEEYFETGKTWTNSIALEGGNDLGTFRLGYTNVDQKGTLPNSGLQRNTISLNASISPTDKLFVSTSMNFVNQQTDGRNVTGYNNANPMQGFTQWWQTNLDIERLKNYQRIDGTQYVWNAIGPVTDGSGNLLSFNAAPQFFDNPYFVRDTYLQEDEKNRLFGNIDVTYDLTDWLTVGAKAMRDGYRWEFREGVPQGGIEQSRYTEVYRTYNETNYQFQLMFDKTFGDFSVNATLGTNRMRQKFTFSQLDTSGGLALDGFFHLSNSVQPVQYAAGNNVSERGINSFYGIASFGYKGMLFLDASLRSDEDSTLPSSQNPFFYPSVSTSFVFSELPVFDGSVVSFGKVRVAYGKASNGGQPYSLSTTYSPVTPNFGTASRFTVPNARSNPNLGPETTTELEFGANVNLFNNRVGVDFTWYTRETVDQVIAVDVSSASGFTSQFENAGTMKNTGIELTLNGTPIQTNDFQWDISLNFASYNNEVVELAPGIQSIGFGGTWAAELRVQEGFPYMGLWGADFIRENYELNDDGTVAVNEGQVVVDANGYPIGRTPRSFLGSVIPDFTGGLRNSFSYKGIQLGVLIDFQKGGILHSTSLQWANYSGMTEETVFQNGVDIRENGLVLDAVTETGEPNTVAADAQTYYQSYFWLAATPNVYDASFVKLREVSLSYTIPQSLVSKTPFNTINVGAFGRNLAILSSDVPHLDPQVITGSGNAQGLENAQVPPTRSIGFNLGFTF